MGAVGRRLLRQKQGLTGMADADALKPLKPEQARASRPGAHVWLSASAGTGKTHVLSARVLRLLLANVPPERILCLTFTKAGAAEMAERVHSRLTRWVQIDDQALFRDLEALGEDSGPPARARARLLFAKVLDATGGGLRIQTIHSFSQALIAAFPLEAGLVPGFRQLDGRAQAELARQALIDMIEGAERDGDTQLIEGIEALALRLGEAGVLAYLARCVPATRLLDAAPDDLEGFLLKLLDLPHGDVDEAIVARISAGAIHAEALKRIAAANRSWGTKSGAALADAIAEWQAAGDTARLPLIAPLTSLLMTKDGLVKNRDKAKLLAYEPDYVALAEAVGGALKALIDLRTQTEFAHLAARGLHVGRAYARAYALAKRRGGWVDFDDLIGRASELLNAEGMAQWIRFKLDQRIDHILVDEAQDTNQAQWDIVWGVVAEFFESEPDTRGALRTLFVVGDTKQAIFGFQGTSPDAFVTARGRFADEAERTGHPFDILPLALSFRSMPAVLEVVDETLEQIGYGAIGLDEATKPHESARRHPGEVLLMPPTVLRGPEEAEDGGDPDDDPTGEDDWHADHQRVHAERIAAQVKAWLDAPLWLPAKGRAVRAGDVLILLRSRGALSRLIVARLYEAGVPVAGVDRLRLQAPLAVRDLLAALRFAVQPQDDLNLANLLVSPLIGWSQDELMTRAIRGDEHGTPALWAHLRATLDEAALAPLRALLARADFTTPYRYLEEILSGAMEGRRKLIARLGEEARDAIEELLNAALAFEADDHPSLQRFIDWFDRGDADVKRELAEDGDMVRVMTVHGAKGLEAPIVLLADATYDPAARPRPDALDLSIREDAALPLLRPHKDEAGARLTEAMEAIERADMEEHWRLLYVAMTRAEALLAVTGALGPRAKGETSLDSWHSRIEQAMRHMDAEAIETEQWGSALQWRGREDLPEAEVETTSADASAGEHGVLPDWLHAPAPAEARPPRPLAPSAAIEDDVPNPPPDAAMRVAAERGRLLHALFERLPDVPAPERRAAGERWLAGAGRVEAAAERREMLDHALRIIDDPVHAALFGPDALAEAPVAAVVGEQVIAGTVDRLLVTAARVDIVDFKTGRHVPGDAAGVPRAHVRQMAAYVAALRVIFPDRAVRAHLLYSSAPRLITLDDALIAAHKPGLATTQDKLSTMDLEPDAPGA